MPSTDPIQYKDIWYLDIIAIDDGSAFRSSLPWTRIGSEAWVTGDRWSTGLAKLHESITQYFPYARLKLFSPLRPRGWRPTDDDAEDLLRYIKRWRGTSGRDRPIVFVTYAAGTKLLELADALDNRQAPHDPILAHIDRCAIPLGVPPAFETWSRTARRLSMASIFTRPSEDRPMRLFQDRSDWNVKPDPEWEPRLPGILPRTHSELGHMFRGSREYRSIHDHIKKRIDELHPYFLKVGARHGDVGFVERIVREMPSGGEETQRCKVKALTEALYIAVKCDTAEVAKVLISGCGSVKADLERDAQSSPLLVAARHGSNKTVSVLLVAYDGHNAGDPRKDRDAGGRTPLMVACEQGHLATVELLLEQASIDDVTETEQTALMLSAKHGHASVVSALLQRKPSVDLEDAGDRTALALSCEGGWNAVAQLLLESDASANTTQHDGLAPLHIALLQGNEALVKMLLKYGADYDKKDKIGRTPSDIAHTESALQLLRSAELYDECDKDQPSLQRVQSLLNDGADIEYQGKAGRTAAQVAKNRGHHALLEKLNDPPLINGPRMYCRTRGKELPWPVVDGGIKCVDEVHGEIIDFHSESGNEQRIRANPHPSIQEMIYREQGTSTDSLFGKRYQQGGQASFRYYHLPGNNLTWVKDLMTRLALEGAMGNVDDVEDLLAGLLTAKDWKDAPMSYASYDKHYRSTRGKGSLPFLRPQATRIRKASQSNQPVEENTLLIMPYLHYERHAEYEEMTACIEGKLKGRASSQTPPHADATSLHIPKAVMDAYLQAEYPLHPRRSLDQFYYNRRDTKQRDSDQVVYRYLKDREEPPQIFMVDQLWLWILNNGRIVISSFPRQWEIKDKDQNDRLYDRQKTDVISSILAKLNSQDRPEIHSAYEMASLIARYCFGTFFDPTRTLGESLQFVEFFELSIGKCSERGVEMLQHLETRLKDWRGDQDDELVNILGEILLLKEIQDIREELSFIDLVFDQQIRAIADLIPKLPPSAGHGKDRNPKRRRVADKKVPVATQTDEDQTRPDRPDTLSYSLESLGQASERPRYCFEDLLTTIRQNRESMRTMNERARRVYNDIYALLDLKQKQASVFEANKTRDLAKKQAALFQKAEEQAKTTARQGKTILVFTIATVFFLPASFMAAFFAIQIDALPKSMPLWWVIKWLMIVTVACSLPLTLAALYVNQILSVPQALLNFPRLGAALKFPTRTKSSPKQGDGPSNTQPAMNGDLEGQTK